jgi:hypothetical protein
MAFGVYGNVKAATVATIAHTIQIRFVMMALPQISYQPLTAGRSGAVELLI